MENKTFTIDKITYIKNEDSLYYVDMLTREYKMFDLREYGNDTHPPFDTSFITSNAYSTFDSVSEMAQDYTGLAKSFMFPAHLEIGVFIHFLLFVFKDDHYEIKEIAAEMERKSEEVLQRLTQTY